MKETIAHLFIQCLAIFSPYIEVLLLTISYVIITAEQVSILYCVGSYFGVFFFPVWTAKSYFLVLWTTLIENIYACLDVGYQIILVSNFLRSFEHH